MDAAVVEFDDELRTINGLQARPAMALAPRRECGFPDRGFVRTLGKRMASDGAPVQFTDDPALAAAVSSAGEIDLEGVTLRVIGVIDLLHEKIRAGSDSTRRRNVLDRLPE